MTMMKRKVMPRGVAAALLLGIAALQPAIVSAQATGATVAEAVATREEMMAYTIGVQAVIYGQPIVDYSRLMRAETDPQAGPRGYAPVNQFYNYGKLIVPGLPQPRAPNHDTLYFRSWVDLRASPLVFSAPDTKGRYYNLDYVDFYSETRAHTGRRTTGTGAQKALLVGPDWKGETPAGMTLVRMPTYQGIVFGRIMVDGASDLAAANDLARQFTIAPLDPAAKASPLELGTEAALDSLDFFTVLNRFLRDNPRMPGEEALMAQFDSIGIGPSSQFAVDKLSPAARRGLERAVKDGRTLVRDGRKAAIRGWSSPKQPIGVYGHDYLSRAAVEFAGLLGNMPEESVYPRIRNDMNGNTLNGAKRYRLTFPKDMPVDAFWSLTPYNATTFDLIPNAIERYNIGERTKGLVRGKDGSVTVEVAATPPGDRKVNWLPVQDGTDFYLILRLYQPRPEVFADGFSLPEIHRVEGR